MTEPLRGVSEEVGGARTARVASSEVIRSILEETRFRVGEDLATGAWELPRGVPPHPLAVLLPPTAAHDAGGASPEHPWTRPLLEVAQGLATSGIAAFHCQPRGEPGPIFVAEAWKTATRHARCSRSRTLACGWREGAVPLLRAVAQRFIEPSGILLLAPRGDVSFRGLGSLPLHLIFATGDAEGCGTEARRLDLLGEARHAGCDVSHDLLPGADATLSLPLPGGGRTVHGALTSLIRSACSRLFVPPWERPSRPPGSAIGDTATSAPG